MATWKTRIRALPGATQILVTGPEGDDLVKAQLPGRPQHPRALLTLLEGLALWSGEALCAAISVDVPADHWLGLGGLGQDGILWPEESALEQCVFHLPARRGRRLAGVGDFRLLRGGGGESVQ